MRAIGDTPYIKQRVKKMSEVSKETNHTLIISDNIHLWVKVQEIANKNHSELTPERLI